VIADLDFDAYVELTCRISGLPLTVAAAGAQVVAESLATACEAVRAALPTGATADWRDQQEGAVDLAKARAASIYKQRRFSDHAPLIIDYDFDLG